MTCVISLFLYFIHATLQNESKPKNDDDSDYDDVIIFCADS